MPQAEVVAGEKLALHHEVTLAAKIPVRWIAVRYPNGKAELKVYADLKAGETAGRDTLQTLPAATAGQPALLAVPCGHARIVRGQRPGADWRTGKSAGLPRRIRF
ncbi:MAG: hypothetical protein WDM96_14150 [Lacunisphaera sp.]